MGFRTAGTTHSLRKFTTIAGLILLSTLLNSALAGKDINKSKTNKTIKPLPVYQFTLSVTNESSNKNLCLFFLPQSNATITTIPALPARNDDPKQNVCINNSGENSQNQFTTKFYTIHPNKISGMLYLKQDPFSNPDITFYFQDNQPQQVYCSGFTCNLEKISDPTTGNTLWNLVVS